MIEKSSVEDDFHHIKDVLKNLMYEKEQLEKRVLELEDRLK